MWYALINVSFDKKCLLLNSMGIHCTLKVILVLS